MLKKNAFIVYNNKYIKGKSKMQKFKEKIINIYHKAKKSENLKAFCFIFFLGLLCFSFEAIGNHFTLPLSGDYTLQTYSFYSQGYHIFWNFIKTGEYPLFDFSNYLGANYLGTQSFYYVFSPLFYLLCLWPEKLLYQGIFFHMIFKFALGGFFMYLLLRKYFHVSFKFSWIGGFIYAFSGWSLFYLWFHFGDVMAFFPLFIMGIEKCLKERKGWLLTVGTFLCGLSNYFFIVNFLIFGVIYALYRWIYLYGINKKRGFSIKTRYSVLLQGILFCGAGILISCVCLFPSLHVVMGTSRTQSSASYVLSLLNFIYKNPTHTIAKGYVLGEIKPITEILSWNNLKHLFHTLFVYDDRMVGDMAISGKVSVGYIISNWLFMNTNCWDNILFSNASLDNSLGGFFITTPLTMLLIPTIYQTIREDHRPWTIFGIIACLALPFFPITANAAFAFTSLYGRWQIWLVLVGIIFIIPSLDKFEKINRRLVTVNLIFNYVLAIIVFNISKSAGKLPTSDPVSIFGNEVSALLILVVIELIGMLAVWAIYRFKFFKPAMVKRIMSFLIILEIGTSVIVTIEHKGYANWDTFYLSQPQYQELNQVIKDIKKDDKDSFYRIMNTEATRLIMNMPSELNYAGASSFNSTYDFELDKFKNRSRMAYGGTWTMGNHEKRYWLDQYLGTKYYIIDKQDINNDNNLYDQDLTLPFDGKENKDDEKQNYRLNLSWNYSLYKSYQYYDVYINNQNIGIGYSVDNYVTDSNIGTGQNATYYEELYGDTVIIEDEDEENIIQQLNNLNKITSYRTDYESFDQNNWDLYFSPREDATYHLTNTYDRQEYQINNYCFSENEINKYLAEGNRFLHKRWEEYNYFGDKFILKLKDGYTPLAMDATDDNVCFVNVNFKLGPKVLISFYNDDVLVTQDAHSNSNSSLNSETYEWKLQRGFYLNQPVNKVVIEFISDTTYSQLFSNGILNKINMNYSYQKDIQEKQDCINNNLISDVTYKNNKFSFKTNYDQKKMVVTNIPYDIGWTLKINNQKQNIYKVNGGFIGFISDENETTYTLSYFTPNLKEGLITCLSGILLFVILWFIYRRSKINILLCEEQISLPYQTKQQEIEKKYFKEHEQYVKDLIEKIKNKFTKRKD